MEVLKKLWEACKLRDNLYLYDVASDAFEQRKEEVVALLNLLLGAGGTLDEVHEESGRSCHQMLEELSYGKTILLAISKQDVTST